MADAQSIYDYLIQYFPTKFSYKKATVDPTSSDEDIPAIVPSFWLNTTTEKLFFYSGTINGWKEAGSGGGGLTPQLVTSNTDAEIGTLYLCDVSNNAITLNLSNFITLNTETGLYECNLSAGDNFEVYIVRGDSTLNTVTLSFTGLQATPYNFNLNLEGQSGSDFIFDNNSYFRFTYSGNSSVGFKINSMTGAVPSGETVGVIKAFAGFAAPSGYFFADGSSKSRTDYKELFNVLTFSMLGTLTSGSKNVTTVSTNSLYVGEKVEGTGIPLGTTIASIVNSTTFTLSNNATITGSTNVLILPYGSLTPTTFILPDLKGKTIFGSNVTDNNFKVGMNGGSVDKLLSVDNIPPHTHSYSTPNGTEWCSNAWNTNESCCDETWGNYTTGSTGAGKAFSILNPYVTLNYIIKY